MPGRVIQCTATELLSGLGDRSVGAIITDPPFHISVGRQANWSEKAGVGEDPWTGDEVDSVTEIIEWTKPIIAQASRTLRLGGSLIVMGGTQSLLAWDLLAPRNGFQWMAELTILWNTGKVRARNFGSLSTRIQWYTKAGSRHAWQSSARSIYSNILVAKKIHQSQRRHPTEKPVGITNFLISLLTKDDDLVVDPFCGSGSTLVSAELCGRPWLGSDLDPTHVKTARHRVPRADSEHYDPIYLWINGRTEEV